MNNQGLFSLLKCFGTSMGDYHKLLEYIPYFENVDRDCCKWDSGYPNYGDNWRSL
jgi:hypothetical protein